MDDGPVIVMFLGTPQWLWFVFAAVVAVLLFLDLGVLHRKQREIGVRESLMLSGGYIAVSLLFGLFVWHFLGADDGMDFYTGYIIEKSLSIDNIFVMALIFSALSIPRMYQHRVLFWGIIGVIILRGVMIGVGAELVENFAWVLYIFAAFLIFTGIKLLFAKDGGDHSKAVQDNPVIRYLKRHVNVADQLHGQKFFLRMPSRKDAKRMAIYITPLLLALITIEIADVIFAVDSVPAIFAITTDPFVVYTSNIFAILGLRSLYFALAAMIERFAYLKYALAMVLIFIGGKVYATPLLGMDKFPSWISLGVTVAILAGGIIVSLAKTKNLAAHK